MRNANLEDFPLGNIEQDSESIELSDSQKEYVCELDPNPENWKGMSREEVLERGEDVQNRLEELGITDVKVQDRMLRNLASPELLGAFRENIFDKKMESTTHLENAQELSKEEVKEQCPQMYETIDLMNKRLENEDPDGIMGTLHYYRTEDGDFILKSDHPEYANTQMLVSDNIIYAETGCNVEGGQYSNYFNECINNERGVANTSYFIDGRSVYEHDSQGRLVSETTVYNNEFNEKVARGTEYQNVIKESKDGIEGDESSHSVPHCLGGSNESINQVPVKAEINHGEGSEWSANERSVKSAVNEGSTVFVEHTYEYEGTSKRPSTLTCSTKIEQEQSHTLEFDNSLEEVSSQKFSENLEIQHIEAPEDNIQVKEATEAIENIEGTKYNEWKELSVEERADVLQKIENSVAEVAHRPSCIINVKPLGENNYGFFDSETGEITVNSNYLTSSYEDYSECLDTIIHEGRHAYQNYNVYYEQVHPNSKDISDWDSNWNLNGYQDPQTYGFEAYWNQPVEADAREFAEKIKNRLLSA